jgi:formylmethanofuran dehydrogenase subunit E
MSYPKFYDTIETIKLQDPLADLLGAFENGEYEISYQEVVKGAGHSCPTVAGAYLMTLMALKELYPNQRAIRGDIKVSFSEDITDGVAGVIANVISYITGATDKSGFKGLGGKFARHDLMFFNQDISNASARFSSISSGKSVDVFYDHSAIPGNPNMQPLMQKLMQGIASKEEKQLFGKIWQQRVEDIFANIDKVIELR